MAFKALELDETIQRVKVKRAEHVGVLGLR